MTYLKIFKSICKDTEFFGNGIKKHPGEVRFVGVLWNAAATYSPTWWGSTIGTGELNCSVRNGKRWDLAVIAAAIGFGLGLRLTRIAIERVQIRLITHSFFEGFGRLVQVD